MKPDSPLLAHSRSRSNEVSIKLRDAMVVIESEIESNDGMYPFNNGRLTLAEVCRRASVHKVTLQGDAHKLTTKVAVQEWIKRLSNVSLFGGKCVRKRVTASVDEWKSRYFDIAKKFNEMYAIDVVSLQARVEAADKKIAQLESENNNLKIRLSAATVVSITNSEKKK